MHPNLSAQSQISLHVAQEWKRAELKGQKQSKDRDRQQRTTKWRSNRLTWRARGGQEERQT